MYKAVLISLFLGFLAAPQTQAAWVITENNVDQTIRDNVIPSRKLLSDPSSLEKVTGGVIATDGTDVTVGSMATPAYIQVYGSSIYKTTLPPEEILWL